MQVGHIAVGMAISTYDWNLGTIAVVNGVHWLPNADVFLIKAGLAKDSFHCWITHTLLFAIVVSALFLPFSTKYALFALISLLAHYLADLPSDIGQQLLWPLSKKKFTLALWKDTGFWGWKTIKGGYAQWTTWVVEGAAFAFLAYRLTVIY